MVKSEFMAEFYARTERLAELETQARALACCLGS